MHMVVWLHFILAKPVLNGGPGLCRQGHQVMSHAGSIIRRHAGLARRPGLRARPAVTRISGVRGKGIPSGPHSFNRRGRIGLGGWGGLLECLAIRRANNRASRAGSHRKQGGSSRSQHQRQAQRNARLTRHHR